MNIIYLLTNCLSSKVLSPVHKSTFLTRVTLLEERKGQTYWNIPLLDTFFDLNNPVFFMDAVFFSSP